MTEEPRTIIGEVHVDHDDPRVITRPGGFWFVEERTGDAEPLGSGWEEVGFIGEDFSTWLDDAGASGSAGRRFMGEQSMTFTTTTADPETLGLLFGQRGLAAPSAFSLIVESSQEMSGAPYVRPLATGWRYWWEKLTGQRRHYERLRAIKRQAWVDAGCPTQPGMVIYHIPRATVR